MTFEFYRFRFVLAAREEIRFPAGKAGNTLRGAFGSLFREIGSASDYARIFAPGAVAGEVPGTAPSGLADWPRPFVFRAAHLDGLSVRPGSRFDFGLHLFDLRKPVLPWFVRAFQELAREGLGARRSRAELLGVEQLRLDGSVAGQVAGQPLPPISLSLVPASPARRVRVRFLTPTELKGAEGLAERPDFGVLFARLRDRIGTLRALYGAGPLTIDFRAMGQRAASVSMPLCELSHVTTERRSSRTGQVHPLAGFLGQAEYQGELAEFLPFLHAGKWTGVGRHTVWGQGELECEVLEV